MEEKPIGDKCFNDCMNLAEREVLSFFQLFRSKPKEISDNKTNLINLKNRKASKTKKHEKPKAYCFCFAYVTVILTNGLFNQLRIKQYSCPI